MVRPTVGVSGVHVNQTGKIRGDFDGCDISWAGQEVLNQAAIIKMR
jgi:hypothetical protein